MTQIDFYVLQAESLDSRIQFACRLAEKAYELGHRVFMHTDSGAASAQLNDALWTFRDGSFVPHDLAAPGQSSLSPVLVGHDVEPESHTDVLINLSGQVPGFFGRFERVAEITCQDAEILSAARGRYKHYRDRGFEIRSHDIH